MERSYPSSKTKISRAFFAINRIKHVINTKHLLTLYYSIVYSHIIYGITLWGAASKNHLHSLNITHKKIIRVIGGAKYNSHTEPILKRMGMLSLIDIYQLQICKYAYKFIRGPFPPALSELFQLSQDVHSHLTRQSTNYKFEAFKSRTLVGSQSIINMGPKLWNNIPSTMYLFNNRLISIPAFSRRLKTYIIAGYV
jgi:hypothetical protein